jgi:glycosyltransferase involved in cell wall biosynthesis
MATRTSARPVRAKPDARSDELTIVAIVPLYNGELWIEQCLASILAQSRLPDEVIVVDDGSTDGGADIVRAIAEKNPLIRMVAQINAGQSAARNLAISLTTCSHVALIDQDDVWYPNHLEELAAAVRDHHGLRLGWVYSDFDDIDINGALVQRDFIERGHTHNPKRDLVRVLQEGFIIQPSATLIARAAILAVGGFDERLSGYEDDDLFLRIFMANYDNVYLPYPTSQWRIHETSGGGSARMESSLKIYGTKLIEMFPNDRWRGFYYRSDIIAPRIINTWLQMYVRASRYKNKPKMKLYAREAAQFVRYLRPRSRLTYAPILLVLRSPLFISFRTATVDEQSIGWAPFVALARRYVRL